MATVGQTWGECLSGLGDSGKVCGIAVISRAGNKVLYRGGDLAGKDGLAQGDAEHLVQLVASFEEDRPKKATVSANGQIGEAKSEGKHSGDAKIPPEGTGSGRAAPALRRTIKCSSSRFVLFSQSLTSCYFVSKFRRAGLTVNLLPFGYIVCLFRRPNRLEQTIAFIERFLDSKFRSKRM